MQGLQRLQATLAKAAATRSALDPSINRTAELPLLDFVPALTPRYERPDHLAKIADALSRADRSEGVRCCMAAPPQHGKTDLELHSIIWMLKRHPDWLIGFCTYGQKLSNAKSREARALARAAGVNLRDDSTAVGEWRTREGGGLLATSIKGSLTGMGLKVLFLDDPYRSRDDARSVLYRDRVDDWLSSVGEPRVHPGGSIFVTHTRWDDDDQQGRLLKRRDANGVPVWEGINLPAIDDDGNPLWKQRPLEFLNAKKAVNEADWWALWMGNPRPRGGGVFKNSYEFDELPKEYRIGKGLDCAYTKSTSADASAGLVLLRTKDPKWYVVDVRLEQLELDAFIPMLREQSAVFAGEYLFATSSTEKGIAQFSKLLPDGDIRIKAKRAMLDKFTRAQPAATAWNRGDILVPGPRARAQLQAMGLDTTWVPRFVRAMNRFTGNGDRLDDEVDALINAYDVFPRTVSGTGGGSIGYGTSHEDRAFGI